MKGILIASEFSGTIWDASIKLGLEVKNYDELPSDKSGKLFVGFVMQ